MNCNKKYGISLIIPTYNGREIISKCVDSLFVQTLDSSLFEVVVVMNGSDDGTLEFVKDYIKNSELANNTLLLQTNVASASHARNYGVLVANFQYIVFLDNDDRITENYLESLLNVATMNSIVLAPVINVINNKYNISLYRNSPKILSNILIKIRFLTMNAGKIIPTRLLIDYPFDESLTSSEDMAVYSAMLISENLEIKILPYHDKACYLREIRDDSLSRQKLSIDFAIKQRYMVIVSILRNIRDYTQLFKPRKFIFLVTRVLGEVIYGIRIIVRSLV